MKRILLSLIIISLAFTSFCQTKETRTVSGFTGIDASSAFDITVTKGNTESLIIEADDNVMPYVRSEVKQGVLHLYLDNGQKIKNMKTLKASIVMKNLDKVSLSGACKLSSNDLFTSDGFTSNCSGASKLNLNLNASQLTVKTSGACNIDLKADVTNDAKFDMSGSSKMQLDLKATNVRVNSSGASTVDLNGAAKSINVNTSGTSNIKAVDFTVDSATIESSGTCNVSLNVNETLKVSSSGASKVSYKGSPTINVNNSGASKVQKL